MVERVASLTINTSYSKEMLKGLGQMFYIMNPNNTSFSNVDDVPNFVIKTWPYFLLFVLVENLLLWIKKKPIYRFNDSLTSISIAVIAETGRLAFRGVETYAYIWLYNNYHVVDLPWNYPLTWYLALIGVDFCYYWMHRACHEVNILWAQHQVHHSSEEFNMVVGLRHSVLQGWCGFIFYLPLSFIIPPAHFIAHQQFNLIFQFWVHTKVIKTLGPLEYIFNTPNHHRVHHGSNFYCLDKNYGGVFIIWDRIFGTFMKEKSDEEIIYGLVVNNPTFNILTVQTYYTLYALKKVNSMKNWKDKVAAIFYGPSWLPTKPRLGAEEDILKVGPREIYDVKIAHWCNVYIFIHFCLVIYIFQELFILHAEMNPLTVMSFICYIMGSLTIIGMLFDNSNYAAICEFIRCALVVYSIENLNLFLIHQSALYAVEVFFVISGLIWVLQSINVLQISEKKKGE